MEDDYKRHEEATKDSTRRTLKTKIKQLTNQVHAERETSIKLSNSKIAILTLEYIRMTLEECKSSEEALSIIQEFVKTTDSQIQSEKQQVWSEHEGDKQPCSDQCYLLMGWEKWFDDDGKLSILHTICGDGSLGEPPRHGDGQCANMNLLLGKKERNPIIKNTCLGEYTGELITHREAEKRGKLYDRINNSYLFNVNDKVMLVGGDHRVGIFAKENIKAGDELFYHYYYNEECAPPWALPPKVEASKTHKYVSQGRAKKH
ncbi:hypothetical protein JHK86_054183 [Glycine max]|nr:hypothetical protein JHK86_054183 [Glycine max]